MNLVPDSGQLNCTQWRKLNAYDIRTDLSYAQLEIATTTLIVFFPLLLHFCEGYQHPCSFCYSAPW